MFMKTWKIILTMCLCALFAVSCSEDEDADDQGNTYPSDIPTGKVAMNMYGMWALFPENVWGNSVDGSFLDDSLFPRECVKAYLKSDVTEGGYNTAIYFFRFKETISKASQADSIFQDYADMLRGSLDEGENDPNLIYIDFKESASTISTFPATRFETVDKKGYYQDNYLFTSGVNMFMVTISIADTLKTSAKYESCKEIINSFKLK